MLVPLRSNQPCGILYHHTHKGHKIRKDQHHSRGFCGQEIASPGSKDSVHTPCFSSHLPVALSDKELLIYKKKYTKINKN
jgi:hypothetical protein